MQVWDMEKEKLEKGEKQLKQEKLKVKNPSHWFHKNNLVSMGKTS
jgi:hypothetical protein